MAAHLAVLRAHGSGPAQGGFEQAMHNAFQFTFHQLQTHFEAALRHGYSVMTCAEYSERKHSLPSQTLVNRIDVDYSIEKAKPLAEIFNRLGIKGTFFIRLHAREYNPFSFENYRILKSIASAGHEIGYHCEPQDMSAIWQESPEECIRRDIDVLERMVGIKVRGAASHNGFTGLNNLDFWKERKASDFGLVYEAYDREPSFNLFQESFYVSDSNWFIWKCYDRGELVKDDRRNLGEHCADKRPLIYSLIHSDTYYNEHFYE